MKHPLAGRNIYFYFAVWAVLMAAHAIVLHFQYNFSFPVALADSFCFNFLVAGLGLTYWYVVQYISPDYQGVSGTFISHVIGVAISISLVSFISLKFLSMLFAENAAYNTFLANTISWRIFIGILYITILIILYYLMLYIASFKQKEQKELQLQNLLKQAELEMLKFQINPHFLFNSLNSISSLTISSPGQAREMVVKLADFFRASLGKNKGELHALKDELAQMNLYLEIEKIRFGERLRIETETDEECLVLTLPNMILQPLYENAIKFGMYEQLGEVTIKTKCLCEEGMLKISVSNNYDPDSLAIKGKGIGLQNVKNLLELIYGLTNLIMVEKKSSIFTVQLMVPQKPAP